MKLLINEFKASETNDKQELTKVGLSVEVCINIYDYLLKQPSLAEEIDGKMLLRHLILPAFKVKT